MLHELDGVDRVFKVLNSKVAEEMEIVENHLITLTSAYHFHLIMLFFKSAKVVTVLTHDLPVLWAPCGLGGGVE